ncbi:MAG: hypothetical protein U0670_23315 [Anaerolineae bacterium]
MEELDRALRTRQMLQDKFFWNWIAESAYDITADIAGNPRRRLSYLHYKDKTNCSPQLWRQVTTPGREKTSFGGMNDSCTALHRKGV